MDIVTTIDELRQRLLPHRQDQQKIALVPTMGNLHQGHLNLVSTALDQSDIVVTSIFVNPLQFGPNEDLASYPRTLDHDTKQLSDAGCHYLFAPSESELYGANASSSTLVQVPELSKLYCGASRPGHFDGVTTVVSKLFNIVQPDIACFGLKDYQQFVLIKRMVNDLAFPIEIVGVEIAREESGLAMSSRNNYLSPQELEVATGLNRVLESTATRILTGERQFSSLQDQAVTELNSRGMQPDYVVICDADSLQPAADTTSHFAILAAAAIGPTRLIDNVRFQLQSQ
ncbi:MAG: pantoate--beta-alanine ligase [Pseudomonadales bacterium]|nr:pantoate--beta-alanine ligase [Pseudomonadales bacterium]